MRKLRQSAGMLLLGAVCFLTEPLAAQDDAKRTLELSSAHLELSEAYFRGNVNFILLRMYAHYLFWALDLPLLGTEDNAADLFAIQQMTRLAAVDHPEPVSTAMSLKESPEQARQMQKEETARQASADAMVKSLRDVEGVWKVMASEAVSNESGSGILAWWKRHGASNQHAFRLMCLTAFTGSDRGIFLGSDWKIPLKSRCDDERSRSDKALDILLGPYRNTKLGVKGWSKNGAAHFNTRFGAPSRHLEIEGRLKNVMKAGVFRRIVSQYKTPTRKGMTKLALNFDECGVSNVVFSEDEAAITMCYEFAADLLRASERAAAAELLSTQP